MNIKKINVLYGFLCKYYVYISFLTISSVLPILYYLNIEINTIFYFTFETLNKKEIIFYLTSNFILCLIYHKIINRLYKLDFLKYLSVLWILPLILQILRILKVLIIYYYPYLLIYIMKINNIL